jgi:hypothetical protein
VAAASARRMASPTGFIAIEDLGDTNEVDWHSQLGVRLNVQRLLAREPGRKAGRCVLPAGEAGVGYVEQLGRTWRRRKRV